MKNIKMILPLIIAIISGVLLILGLFTDYSFAFAIITLSVSIITFVKYKNKKEQNWPTRIGVTACFTIILVNIVYLMLYILTITLIPDILADII